MSNGFVSARASLALLLACAACQGYVRGSDSAGGSPAAGWTPPAVSGGQASGGSAGQQPGACDGSVGGAPLPARLRRLTPTEYGNSLRSLLGDALPQPQLDFPPDAALGTYHNAASLLRVTDLLANGLAAFAQKLAQSATEQLPALLGCEPAAGDELACVRGFIERFATKAYRRPLSPSELQTLLDVFAQGREGADARAGVALALEVIFQSPHLLYRTELGAREATTAQVRLTEHELASSLAYLLTLGPPDTELDRAANAGELGGADAREAQARRLLQEPSARVAISAFAAEWLDIGKLPTLSKDAALFPGFNPESARAMQRRTLEGFGAVVFEGDGKLRSLLAGGLLTEPSVLAAQSGTQWSSPTHRGKLLLNQLLCQTVPPPPPGLIVTVPPAMPGVTTRQRMVTHASDPGCAGCHARMDPLGFAFEHYDAVGAYRADENGLPIDASGRLTSNTDADGEFDGAQSLTARLSDSADVRACFAKQWTTFALGAEVDAALSCALAQPFADFGAERLSLSELLVRVVRSDAFVERRVISP